MDISKIQSGKNVPEDINAVVEIEAGSELIKYELDKDSGAMFVNRIQDNAMHYPCAYGFVPQTMANDGDPVDVLIICKNKIMSGCVINVRPVGVLLMEDEGGIDEKIITVPNTKVSKYYDKIKNITDISDTTLEEIRFFFLHYKDLEESKWTRVQGFEGVERAKEIIKNSLTKS